MNCFSKKSVEAARSSGIRQRQVVKSLLLLAGPMIISITLQSANGFIEILLASRSGVQILGVISLGGLIELVPTAFLCGLVYAVVPAVGRMKGEDNMAAIKPFLAQALSVAVVVALFFGLLIILFADYAMNVIGVAPELVGGVQTYLYFVPLFMLGNTLFALGRCFVEAYNYPLLVTISVLIGIAAKVLAVYTLVFGHFGFSPMGVIGFAISGVIYYLTINVVLTSFALLQRRMRPIWQMRVTSRDFQAQKLFAFFRSGVPVGLNFSSDVLLLSVMGISISTLSVQSVGAHSLVSSAVALAQILATGIATASAIVMAQASGQMPASGLAFVVWRCVMLGLLAILLPALAFWLTPETIFQWYAPDPELLPLILSLTGIIPWYLVMATIGLVLAFILRGLDDGLGVMWISLIACWLISLPLGYALTFTDLLVPRMGVAGWWYANLFSNLFLALALTIRLAMILPHAVRESLIYKAVA